MFFLHHILATKTQCALVQVKINFVQLPNEYVQQLCFEQYFLVVWFLSIPCL